MRTKKTVMLCFIISLVTGFLGAALRTVCLLAFYSTESGHFTRGNAGILPDIAWGACIVGAAAALLICLVNKKPLSNYEEKGGMLYTVGATLAVCAVLAVIFESLSAFLNGDPASRTVNMIIVISAFVSCIVLFTNTFFPIKGIDPVRAGISLIPAIFVVLPAYRLYFEPTLVMNCPNKNVYILAVCLVAAMIIYEGRFHTEMRNTALYVASCCGAFTFGIFCSVPNLIYSAVHGGVSVINSLAADLLVICFAIFAAIQLLSLHRIRNRS